MTGGRIGDRLLAEAETNLAINVIPGLSESYEVQGRGELQLGKFLLIFVVLLCFLPSLFLIPPTPPPKREKKKESKVTKDKRKCLV